MNNNTLPRKKAVKYLGITLTDNLRFDSHMKAININTPCRLLTYQKLFLKNNSVPKLSYLHINS